MAAQQLAKQAEIAESSLGGEELSGQDFSGSIVLQATAWIGVQHLGYVEFGVRDRCSRIVLSEDI